MNKAGAGFSLLVLGCVFGVEAALASVTPLAGSSHVPLLDQALGAKRASGERRQAKSGWSDLPAQAQGAISRVLGREQTSYHLRLGKKGWQGSSPAHGLALRFTGRGAEVAVGSHRWEFSLAR